ncbi:MAG: hypothetical protein ACYDIC_02780 [Desulfobaccales bacterium]
MKNIDDKIIKLLYRLGWILVVLGGLFTVWAFILFLLSSRPSFEPIMLVFFIGLIFCSIAVGLFFVVLSIIVITLKQIEKNTEKQ